MIVLANFGYLFDNINDKQHQYTLYIFPPIISNCPTHIQEYISYTYENVKNDKFESKHSTTGNYNALYMYNRSKFLIN